MMLLGFAGLGFAGYRQTLAAKPQGLSRKPNNLFSKT